MQKSRSRLDRIANDIILDRLQNGKRNADKTLVELRGIDKTVLLMPDGIKKSREALRKQLKIMYGVLSLKR